MNFEEITGGIDVTNAEGSFCGNCINKLGSDNSMAIDATVLL